LRSFFNLPVRDTNDSNYNGARQVTKMAELAVISSGFGIASFAIQVADSVVKLKDFIDSVREAPEESSTSSDRSKH
jgi:hypothetical protein